MDTSVLLNTEATFTCTISPEFASEVVITWSGPDPSLPSPVNSVENGRIISNLTINVTDGRYQSELYSCSARFVNSLMVVTSDPATFSIISPPMITEPPIGGDFDINSSLALTCTAMNYGTVSITWTGPAPDLQGTNVFVNNTAISNSYNTLLSNHSLGGIYTCIATNEHGSDNASATVFVRPVVLPERVIANNGDEVTLMCYVQTYPRSTILWERLRLGIFDIVGSGRTLTFSPPSVRDHGFYRCFASIDGEPDKFSTFSEIRGKCNGDLLSWQT